MEPGEIVEYKTLRNKNRDQEQHNQGPDEEEEEEISNLLSGRIERVEEVQNRSKWEIFKINVYMIYASIQNPEIYKPLIFFVSTGFMVPNYDDVTYYFLLDTCKISQESYDYLNMS